MSEGSSTTANSTVVIANNIVHQITAHSLPVYATVGIFLAVFGVCLLSGGIIFLMWRVDRSRRPQKEMFSEWPRSELEGNIYNQKFSDIDPGYRGSEQAPLRLRSGGSEWNIHEKATNSSTRSLQYHERHVPLDVLTPKHGTETKAPILQNTPAQVSIEVLSPPYFPEQAGYWNREQEHSDLLSQPAVPESRNSFSRKWMSKENPLDALRQDDTAKYVHRAAPGGPGGPAGPADYCLLFQGRNQVSKEELVALAGAEMDCQRLSADISKDYEPSAAVVPHGPVVQSLSSQDQYSTLTNLSDSLPNNLRIKPADIAYHPRELQPSSPPEIDLASIPLDGRDSDNPLHFWTCPPLPEMVSTNSQLSAKRSQRSAAPTALQLSQKRTKTVCRKDSNDIVRMPAQAERDLPNRYEFSTLVSTICSPISASTYENPTVYTSPSSAGLSESSSRYSISSCHTGITEFTPTTPADPEFSYVPTSVALACRPSSE